MNNYKEIQYMNDIFDDIEQAAYVSGWKEGYAAARVSGSWWLWLVCFLVGVIVGVAFK